MSQIRARRQPLMDGPVRSTPLAQLGNPPSGAQPSVLDDAESMRSLYGERTSRQGETQHASLAGKALKNIVSDRPAFPIYEPYYLLLNGSVTYNPRADQRAYLINEADKQNPSLSRTVLNSIKNLPDWNETATNWSYKASLTASDLPIFNHMLRKASKLPRREDRPIVMLITTGLPHAIIYILDGSDLYTCGYGFQGFSVKSDSIPVAEKMERSDLPVISRMGHTFDVLPGAIYTADFLAPDETRMAKIAWIDFLNEEHVNRIQEFLNHTRFITYEGEVQYNSSGKKVYTLSSFTNLVLDKTYMESSGFLPSFNDENRSYNCLLWAQKILNINIDCGALGNPKDCRELTEEQWQLFLQNLNNPSKIGEVVDEIQRSLTKEGLCTRIGKALHICGGGTRRRRKRRFKRTKRSSSRKRQRKGHRLTRKRR